MRKDEPRRVYDAALYFARTCGIDTHTWKVVGFWADNERVMFDLAQLDGSIPDGLPNHVFPIYQVTLQMADSLPEDESDA